MIEHKIISIYDFVNPKIMINLKKIGWKLHAIQYSGAVILKRLKRKDVTSADK